MTGNIFRDPVHEIMFADFMRKVYSTNFLSDVVLVTSSGVEIKAHRFILASYSEFFRTKFQTAIGLKGGSDEKVIIDLSSDLNGAFGDVIEYMYSGEIKLTEDNIFLIVEIESLLLVSSLKPLISQYLCSSLSKNNCLYIADQSDFFGYRDVSEIAVLYSKENFSEIIIRPEFLEVSFRTLVQCLDPPYLVAPTEDQLLLKLCEWINYDMNNRIAHLRELLNMIEPTNISNWKETILEAKNILSDCLLNDMKGDGVFNEWMEKAQVATNSNSVVESRYCQSLGNVILAIGGSAGEKILSSVECLSCLQSMWKLTLPTSEPQVWSTDNIRPIPLMCTFRTWLTATSSMFDAYVIGCNEVCDSTIIERYSIIDNKWYDMPTLNVGTKYSALAYSNGSLYYCGGMSDNKILKNMWVLPVNANSWREVAPMLEARFNHRLVALNGLLYAVGGSGDNSSLNTVERYDPFSNSWIFVSQMNFSRAGHGCTVIDNCIYAVGGTDSGTDCKVNERYDVNANKWVNCGKMRISHYESVKVAAFKKNIVVSGGHNSQRMSIFNVCTETSIMGPSLNETRVGHAFAALKIPVRKKSAI